MKEKVLHTPQAHIPIACVSAEDGVIYLRFKKNKTDVYETITLDQFVILVADKVKGYDQSVYRDRYYD